MKKCSLSEMVKRARGVKFSMPPEVNCQKRLLPNGRWNYIFRHRDLGELGRLLILPYEEQCQFCFEVVREEDDPMTQKRREILEPITRDILDKMEMVCGKGVGEPMPYISPKDQHIVKSEYYPCEKCGAATSMLVFAPDAYTADRLEDYARMMYSKVKEMDVPTWVAGAEEEVIVDGEYAGKALVLKIWPKREKARVILSIELNAEIDKLMDGHCKAQ